MLFVVHHRTEWVLICKVTTFFDKCRMEVRENNHRIIESSDHRNLDGIYTDFIELLRKKSLEEIFFKMLLRKK